MGQPSHFGRTGLHLVCPKLTKWAGKSGSSGMWNHPRGHVWGISGFENLTATFGAGEIGITEDSSIANNISLNSADGTTFNTTKYVWGDNGASIAEGTAIERYGCDRKKALDLIAKSDKGRARHFATFTDWDWGDRSNYDLMVNSGSVGIDRSVEIICSCAEEMGL